MLVLVGDKFRIMRLAAGFFKGIVANWEDALPGDQKKRWKLNLENPRRLMLKELCRTVCKET